MSARSIPAFAEIGILDGKIACVSERAEMAAAYPAKVRAWVDGVLLAERTRPSRARSRGVSGAA